MGPDLGQDLFGVIGSRIGVYGSAAISVQGGQYAGLANEWQKRMIPVLSRGSIRIPDFSETSA